MSLKGGSAEHTGDPLPDRWSLNIELEAIVGRCHIDPVAIWPTQWIRLKAVKEAKA